MESSLCAFVCETFILSKEYFLCLEVKWTYRLLSPNTNPITESLHAPFTHCRAGFDIFVDCVYVWACMNALCLPLSCISTTNISRYLALERLLIKALKAIFSHKLLIFQRLVLGGGGYSPPQSTPLKGCN